MTAIPTIEAMVKMISWLRTNQVSISYPSVLRQRRRSGPGRGDPARVRGRWAGQRAGSDTSGGLVVGGQRRLVGGRSAGACGQQRRYVGHLRGNRAGTARAVDRRCTLLERSPGAGNQFKAFSVAPGGTLRSKSA